MSGGYLPLFVLPLDIIGIFGVHRLNGKLVSASIFLKAMFVGLIGYHLITLVMNGMDACSSCSFLTFIFVVFLIYQIAAIILAGQIRQAIMATEASATSPVNHVELDQVQVRAQEEQPSQNIHSNFGYPLPHPPPGYESFNPYEPHNLPQGYPVPFVYGYPPVHPGQLGAVYPTYMLQQGTAAQVPQGAYAQFPQGAHPIAAEVTYTQPAEPSNNDQAALLHVVDR